MYPKRNNFLISKWLKVSNCGSPLVSGHELIIGNKNRQIAKVSKVGWQIARGATRIFDDFRIVLGRILYNKKVDDTKEKVFFSHAKRSAAN